MSPYQIKTDDLSSIKVQNLLKLHMQGMMENSPADNVFALDLSGLQQPNITVWTAWRDDELAGIGALKQLDNQPNDNQPKGNQSSGSQAGDGQPSGEIKSMRTAPDFLRQGVALALLDHIINYARSRNFKRLSLETGSGPSFDPALTLYRKRGFTNGEAFGNYEKSEFNQFMHLTL